MGCDTPGVRLAVRAIPEHARVLDAACGLGIDALWLAERGRRVTATDASSGMVAEARRRLAASDAPGVDVRRCGWDDLGSEFPPDSFDAVLCVGSSIAHAPHLRRVLSAFGSVLVSGGLLILDSRDWEATTSAKPVVEVEPVIVEREGRRCRRSYRWAQPEPSGPVELRATLEFLGDDGSVSESMTWTLHQHAFTRQDLRAALERAGFGSIALDRIPGDDRYTATARRR